MTWRENRSGHLPLAEGPHLQCPPPSQETWTVTIMRCSPNLGMTGSSFTLTTPEGKCPTMPPAPRRHPCGCAGEPAARGRGALRSRSRVLALLAFLLICAKYHLCLLHPKSTSEIDWTFPWFFYWKVHSWRQSTWRVLHGWPSAVGE